MPCRRRSRAWAWHYYAHEEEKRGAVRGGLSQRPEFLAPSLRTPAHGAPGARSTSSTQDREFYFPNEMLRKVDRMTMAYSVEGRVPFAAPSVLVPCRQAGILRI